MRPASNQSSNTPATSVTARLDPPPVPTASDIRNDGIVQAIQREDPKTKREFTFDLKYTDESGTLWAGRFTNKILTIGERSAVASYLARLFGGMPYDSIDPNVRDLTRAVAHMTYSLNSERKPEWADDLFAVVDDNIILELWEEVVSHETTFRGRTGRQSSRET